MNKLILIGNGFDLHHGIPTDYSSFLNWYISKLLDNDFNKKPSANTLLTFYFTKKFDHHKDLVVKNLSELSDYILRQFSSIKHNFVVNIAGDNYSFRVQTSSVLLRKLLEDQGEKNWVDIEMEYYRILKDILKSFGNYTVEYSGGEKDIISLNNDLNTLKRELEDYLSECIKGKCVNPNFNNDAQLGIKKQNILEAFHIDRLSDEDFDEDDRDCIVSKNVLFLSFNYTGLCHQLKKGGEFSSIEIHGSLNSRTNPLIFGFGDEIDGAYNEMERLNINSFFTHIKSFGYFNNSNYSDLVRFINSDSFFVEVWGHSCGLSDRTLLNMIFENDNCAAIRPKYWKRTDGTDNYVEITQNISRHFRNKLKMRNRVLNKDLCSPM